MASLPSIRIASKFCFIKLTATLTDKDNLPSDVLLSDNSSNRLLLKGGEFISDGL